MTLLLGFDLGTFEAKGVLVDESGRVRASATRAYSIITPAPGLVEHDADEQWWGSFCEIVAELTAAVPPDDVIGAIACSGIGPAVLPVDDTGTALRTAILYGIDTRASEQIATIEADLGTTEILRRSGNQLSSQSAGPKIAWLRDNDPGVHSRAARFVTSQTYIVGRLTGRWVIDHGTAAYFHPLYDLTQQRWDIRGCEWFVRDDQLPELAWAGEIAGEVSASGAVASGLPEGVPVLVGTADALAEAFSCGTVEPGDMMAMYGSSHFFIELVKQPITDADLYAAPYLFPGSSLLAAGTSTAGSITRWFIDLLGVTPGSDGSMFAELADEAMQSPPGANGLLSLPYFSGERTPLYDPDARGVIAGLTVAHRRADVYRSLLEGIAYGVGEVFQTYAAAGAAPSRVRAVGGGTRNPLWLSVVSDVSGVDQDVCAGRGASFGDAMLAALAIGVLPDPASAGAWVQVEGTVRADAGRHEFYRGRAAAWSRLRDATLPVVHELARSTRDPR